MSEEYQKEESFGDLLRVDELFCERCHQMRLCSQVAISVLEWIDQLEFGAELYAVLLQLGQHIAPETLALNREVGGGGGGQEDADERRPMRRQLPVDVAAQHCLPLLAVPALAYSPVQHTPLVQTPTSTYNTATATNRVFLLELGPV